MINETTMVALKKWQWILLISPIAVLVSFLLISAGWQIHQWGINWIWGLFILILAGWRWLLVKWTRPAAMEIETAVAEAKTELATAQAETATLLATDDDVSKTVESALQTTLESARNDLPIWEDWNTFWQRCQDLIVAVAHAYHPEVKYPLLNIYIPQAYGLMRGTVDDMDRWMQQLSPALNKVTVGQGFEAYEVYRKLEPSARKLWRVLGFAQWFLNPAAA
ncbi:MAG: GTPase, partial [Spirulinaceae cyanobacterium]